MPQIRGIQGRSRSTLLRALGNDGDGVLSAFPQGKQNGNLLKFYVSWIEGFWQSHPNLQNTQLIKHLKYVSHFVYDQLGLYLPALYMGLYLLLPEYCMKIDEKFVNKEK
jgi:hypothetical protein